MINLEKIKMPFLYVSVFIMRKITLILAFLIFSFARSQEIKVYGNVLDGDSDNSPMAFVSIKVNGLDINTETDENGKYALSLMDGEYVLIIDFIGYEAVELSNVLIEDKNILLNPVVMRSKRPGYDLATIDQQE